MNLPKTSQLTSLLIEEIRKLGWERRFETLTISELDTISNAILAAVVDAQQDDEPPF